MRNIHLVALMVACTPLLVAACSKKVSPVASAVPPPSAARDAAPPPTIPASPEPAPVPAAAMTEDDLFARKTLAELNAERPLADALFDFDQHVLRDDARAVLQANAGWLRRWASTRITIEGHCDSRGTREYNLALGERRADAVRDYLVSLGVGSDRVLVVSKGEESPVCADEHEGCWQQNRRGHPVIIAK